MLGTKTTPHPTDDQLYDYCHSRLDEVEGSLIASHIEDCPDCAAKLEQGRRLLTVLGGFSPEGYGAAYHRDVLRRALLAAARRVQAAAHRRRLVAWARREPDFAGLVLQWTPGASRKPPHLELVRTFTGSSPWHLEAGSAPGKPLDSVEPHGSVWPAAVRHLGVLVRHWPEAHPPPLVVLAREGNSTRPEVQVPRRNARRHARFASFPAPRPGRFILGFEPTAGSNDLS